MTAAMVSGLTTRAHRVGLPQPEADGTLAWTNTTVVTVTARAGDETGLGWTYGPAAVASIVVMISGLLLERACRVPRGDDT